ncbi:MAG: sugar-binding protein [Lentisphaerota bacterium]
MKKRILFGLILLMFLAPVVRGTSVFIEAECFDKLPYHGNWVDEPGWYAKRHTHASGGAFAVSHHDGSIMTSQLLKPLEAGSYDVYLRMVLNRSANTKNELRVSLGRMSADGTFKAECEGKLVEDFQGSGYSWLKVSNAMNISSGADTVAIEALTVQNKGIGDDPEYAQPYAIVDSVIITNEKVEYIAGKKQRNELKFPVGTDPCQEIQPIPYPQYSPNVDFEALPHSKVFVSAKNLLRNSSFEICLKPHFAAFGSMICGFNVDADNLCTDNPFDGRYCLEFIPEVEDVTKDYSNAPEKPRLGGALNLYALGTFLRPEIEALAKQGPLTLSMYVRTNGRKISLQLDGRTSEANHTEWRRYSSPLPKGWATGNVFKFNTDDPDARVWLDAIQLERGSAPTEYAPLEGLEIGFQSRAMANIFYRSDSFPLEAVVTQGKDGKPAAFTIKYTLFNSFLEKECEGSLSIASQPGKTVGKPVSVPFGKLGSYLFMYEVEGHPEQSYAMPINVVENPAGLSRNRMLGVIISSNEEIMKLMHRAGFDWVNSLNDRLVLVQNLWPAENEFRDYSKYWRQWQSKYDIQYSIWTVPFISVPKWDKGQLGTEAAAHMGKPNMSYGEWGRFWEQLTKRAEGIDIFMPVDELSYHRGPSDALPYVEIANKIIRKNRPGATIMTSCQAVQFREMLKLKPDLDIGDAIGGSRHDFERNLYFYDRSLKEDTKKQFWIVGVGWGHQNSWYGPINFESFVPDKDTWQRKFTPALDHVRQTLFEEASVIGIERFGAYVAKFDRGSDPWSFFAGDSTFNPFAIQFINTVNFLRKHKAGGVIMPNRAEGVKASYVYRDGKVCVMLAPTGSCPVVRICLDVPVDKVHSYDFNLNPVVFKKEFELSEGKCLIVEDAGVGGDSLISAVREMVAMPSKAQRQIIVPGKDGLKLSVYEMENGVAKMILEQVLAPYAGYSQPLDLDRNSNSYLWGSVAAKVAPAAITLDGASDESSWQTVAPSFIYCWPSLDGSYGAFQGIEGFGRVFSLKNISSTHRALWDGKNIYLSFNVLDDKVEQGDRIVLKFDADVLGDFDSQEANSDDYEIVIEPASGKSDVTVRNAKGEQTGSCAIAVKLCTGGYGLEIKIPLMALKVPADQPRTLGLAVELIDVDGTDKSILSWCGNLAPLKSPRGYGQLILAW